MRHHERGFAFAMDEKRRADGYLWPSPPVSGPSRPRQFLSSAVLFENSQDVLRRVRSRRADIPGPLCPGFPEEASGGRASGGPRHRTLHVVRLLPNKVGLVQDRPRARPHGTPSRDDPEAGPVGTRHVHARRPRGGREQPLANREGARTVRGPAVRPRLPSPCADQALSLRFVPEAAGPVLRRHLAGPAAFVSRIEEVHGGLDFYLSKNALGKALARELSESFGGSVSLSPKLFGQKQGREVYRVTSLVRLGPFHIGDVVRFKGSLAEVTSVRPFVILRDLASGESRRFKPKDVRSAKRVDAERFEAKIEHLESGQIVAVHPESEEARPVRPSPKDRTAHAVVVWTRDAAYLSLLPPESSKP